MTRRAVVLAVTLPVAITCWLLWKGVIGEGDRSASVARAAFSESRSTQRTPGLLDLSRGAARDLYIENLRTVVLGDASRTYPRTLIAAARSDSPEPGRVQASSIVVLFNPVPKNEHDLERLVGIGSLSAEDAGRATRDAFGRVPGLMADAADIRGARDLTTIDRLDLSGNVRVRFIDPEVPTSAAELETESLGVLFEEGEPVRAETSARVTLTRPNAKDAQISGVGAEIDLKSGVLRLLHDIRVELASAAQLGGRPEPIVVTGGGPLVWSAGRKASGTASRPGLSGLSVAGSRATIGGGIRITQGDLTATSRDAAMTFSRNGATIETVELLDSVRLEMPDARLSGTRLLLTPDATGSQSPIVVEGSPVLATLANGRRVLPGERAATGDLDISANGRIAIRPAPDEMGATEVYEVALSHDVHADGGATKLDARELKIWVGRIPSQKAEATSRSRQTLPFRAWMSGAILTSPMLDLRAKEVAVRRERDAAGVPKSDLVTLKGDYEVRLKAQPGAESMPASQPASRPALMRAFDGGGEIIATGRDTLELVHAPFEDAPLFVTARGGVSIRARKPGRSDAEATLDARMAELILTPEPSADPDRRVVRRLTMLTARSNVVLEVPGRARARGGLMRYEGATRQLVLEEEQGTTPAHVTLVSKGGVTDQFRATKIVLFDEISRVVATGRVMGDVHTSRLPWMRETAAPGPVATSVSAQRVVIDFDREKIESGVYQPASISCEIGVTFTQPDRSVTAESFHFDVANRSGTIRGSPVHYRIKRTIDGVEYTDSLEGPQATLTGDEATLAGPVAAVLHISPDRLAISLRDVERGAAPADPAVASSRPAAPPRPLTITCQNRVSLLTDSVRASGRVVVRQGDPRADGLELQADDATLFFLPADVSTSALDVGLAVLTGRVKYTSREYETFCDVMKFDRVRKLAVLFNNSPTKVRITIRNDRIDGEIANGVSKLVIDLSTPGKPRIIASDHEAEMLPTTRKTGQ